MERFPQPKTPIKTITRRTSLFAAAAALALPSIAQQTAPSPDHRSNGKWTAGTPLPYAIQEIYPTLHDGQIHLAGGFISDGDSISGATDHHIAMNPETGYWIEVSRLPSPRHHPNLISFDGHLLSVGGFEIYAPESVWVMQAGVWAFDGMVWNDAPALPQPNGESVCAIIDGPASCLWRAQARGK